MRKLDLRKVQDEIKQGLVEAAIAVQTPDGSVYVHEAQAADYIVANVQNVLKVLVLALKPFSPKVQLDISKETPFCVVEGVQAMVAVVEGTAKQVEEGQAGEVKTGEEPSVEAKTQAEGQPVEGQEAVAETLAVAPTVEEERAEVMAKREQRRLDYEAAKAAREAEEKLRAGKTK